MKSLESRLTRLENKQVEKNKADFMERLKQFGSEFVTEE